MKKYNRESWLGGIIHSWVTHYNHKKFWYMRKCVVSNIPQKNKLVRLLYLIKIKKIEAYNCASFGTAFGSGAKFKTDPVLPHGITSTFISHSAKIGSNCVIMQNVTIGSSKKKAPIIGDNCIIGASAVIIGGINIGNNVRIGANCVVVHDVKDNCTVVMPSPRVIYRGEEIEKNWKF